MGKHRKIAIAHEHFPQHGGGEHVAEELSRVFNSPIYTGFVCDGVPSDDVEIRELAGGLTSRLFQRGFRHDYIARDLWYMWSWEKANLADFDVIIQSGNNPGWYVPQDDQSIVRYCHSTPRTPYDLFHKNGTGLISRLYAKAARTLYQQTVPYPTLWAANSELVAHRIEKYFDVNKEDIRVVYPPVDVKSFGSEQAATDDYYLTLSRLFANKCIGEIVRAFDDLDAQLVVAGKGPERDRLEELAGDNVHFTGYVSESKKREILSRAKAFVFAANNEDFGMAPVEAMASGTPVLGVDDGYTKYQVSHGKNGLVFERGALRSSIVDFEREGVDWSPQEIEEFAERYSRERFADRMSKVVDEAVERDRVEAGVVPSERPEFKVVADGGN